jgi:dTDP-glucose 4,6-dehydratase
MSSSIAPSRILVTGGAGFIGSALCRHLVNDTEAVVLNYDKLTYAASLSSLAEIDASPRYRLVKGDVADPAAVAAAISDFRPTAIMHLAAESHVDRSITGAGPFVQTNIVGPTLCCRPL